MKIADIRELPGRWTQDRRDRTGFEEKYLIKKKALYIFGIRTIVWLEDIRVIPVHEWARNAFGEGSPYPDTYPAGRLNGESH